MDCKKVSFWGTIVCMFAFVNFAFAAPKLISYQGVLNDQSGVPISSTLEISFTIYDAATEGNALWSETQNVQVTNGLLDVKLGSVQALTTSVLFCDTLYLGIKVGVDPEMVPRQRITPGIYVHTVGLPIGSISAWAKDIPGMPALSEGWVECNGQVLDDPQSPLNGQTIPDLNRENRFLRGNSTSGDTGGAETHQHFSGLLQSEVHDDTLYIGGYGKKNNNTRPDLPYNLDRVVTSNDISDRSIFIYEDEISAFYDWDSPGRDDYYTSATDSRPPYYNVVWIMKVK